MMKLLTMCLEVGVNVVFVIEAGHAETASIAPVPREAIARAVLYVAPAVVIWPART
jgi:hypothetical protein